MKVILQFYEHGDAILMDLHATEVPYLLSMMRVAQQVFKDGDAWHHSDRKLTPQIVIVNDDRIVNRMDLAEGEPRPDPAYSGLPHPLPKL